jgi:aspartyl-tRNA(Asn)/glutamyl-tRNA(Gln) amidotransferase subunit A
VKLPFAFSDFLNAQAILQAEAWFNDGALAADPSAMLDEAVRARLLEGSGLSAQNYLATKLRQVQAKQAMAAALAGTDALLTPSTAMPAIRLDEVDQAVMPSRFTRFGNFLEMCALSLPNGFTAGGLPLSLQICCQGYEEATALRIGYALQQVTDHHLRLPPMVA